MVTHGASLEDAETNALAHTRRQLPALREGELVAHRFVIDRLAGVGGMGAVYRALDLQTRQPAAVKIIARARKDNTERFSREAVVLAGMSHPCIVRYLAHGTTLMNAPFLAMEWLDGEDLAARLARSTLSLSESFVVLRRVCEGLACAHNQSVVHRDIKPSNIFLVDGEPQRAKLLDFGVARHETRTRALTQAGAVIGTVGYMAPEQAMGALDVDARADVFALGCVLFEMLTGRAAFEAYHEVAVLAKVLREEPPHVSELRPGAGPAIDALVLRMLSKDREARPRNAEELLGLLDAVALPSDEVPATRERAPRNRLTDNETRIVSVVLGRASARFPETLPLEDSARDAERFDEVVRVFDAEATPLQGGALLLVLGSIPGGHASDQAMQAARCALLLRQLRPGMTLGLATGAVETSAQVPVGAAIDRAAALLESAIEGSVPVAVDELTAGLLGSRFDLQYAHGLLTLIGELEDVEAPRLLMGKATPCVGRGKELATLEATLQECIEDDVARVVLVEAPPGIGKSRLGHEFLEGVRARGSARVLLARADPVSAGSPLSLIQRLLRSATGIRAGAPAALQQQRLRSYLAPLLPSDAVARTCEFLAELLGAADEGEVSALLRTGRADPEVMREQYRRALESWLDAESARRPLVLLVEDLHWGDLPSVAYLEDALHTFARRPILLLALARPEVHDTFPKLWRSLGCHRIELHGLSQRAAERLVRATLSVDTSAEIVTRIVDLAEGNAFYLEELIRRAAAGVTEFPDTVLAIVQSRLNALAPEARRVLRAASVFGETAWADGVQALLGASADSEYWLDTLAQQELLQLHPQGRFPNEREYVFRHAFLRDAAYGMLGAADRRRAHKAAAEWLEARGEKDARVLADHYERGDAVANAIPWLVRAALSAIEGGDFVASKVLSQRGLALGAEGHARGALLLVSANASAWSSTPDISQLPEALDLLPHASAQWWLAVSGLIFGASANGDVEAAANYLTLAATTEPGPELTGFYGQALQTLASSSVLTGQTDLGWSLVERFDHVEQADAHCDQLFLIFRDLARTHLATYSPIRGRWQLQRALGWAEASVTALDAAGSKSGESIALFMQGTVLLFLGAYDDAHSTFARSLSRSMQVGNTLIQQYSELLLSWVAVRQGRVSEVISQLDQRSPCADSNVEHGVHCVRAAAYLADGRYQQALEEALPSTLGPAAPYRRMAWSIVARAHLCLGHDADALAVMDSAALDGNVAPNMEFEIDLRNTRVRALLRGGLVEQARDELRAALTLLGDVASGISDERLRDIFTHEVAAHRELAELANAWLKSDAP